MEQVKKDISLNDSTEKDVVTKSSSNINTDELIDLSKRDGLNHNTWVDLCIGAASRHGESSVSFRNRLVDDLDEIGIQIQSLFCHKQSAKCGYSNAWKHEPGRGIQMTTVGVDGNYFSAFLIYTI